jgi:hypothetical protein
LLFNNLAPPSGPVFVLDGLRASKKSLDACGREYHRPRLTVWCTDWQSLGRWDPFPWKPITLQCFSFHVVRKPPVGIRGNYG